MFDEHRRPWGRLFYLLAFVVVGLTASWAQTPSTTTISDVVYARTELSAGAGSLPINLADVQHQAFTGQAVAAAARA